MGASIPNSRINSLDLIRGIAVLGVFCFHSVGEGCWREQLPWSGMFRSFAVSKWFLMALPLTIGSSGVAVFFALSGFCIHLSFRRSPGWWNYAVRRFFRIYPPYLFALLVFSFLYPVIRLAFERREDVIQFMSHLFLVHNLSQLTFSGVNPAFWSIAVEVQLYALYPLLLLMAWRMGWRRAILALCVLEILIRTACYIASAHGIQVPRWASDSPLTYCFSWSVGAYVAEAYLNNAKMPFANWSIPVMLAVSIGSRFISVLASYEFLFFSLTTAVVLSRILDGTAAPSLVPGFVSRHLSLAGTWSYTIYLIHSPLIIGLGTLLMGSTTTLLHHPLVRLPICLSSWFVIMPCSGLIYRWCELPSIELGKRFLRGKKTAEFRVTAPGVTPLASASNTPLTMIPVPMASADSTSPNRSQKSG